MRVKEMKVVITFETITSAMAMEKVCKAECCSGRLIPIPRSITAGCGLCWSAQLNAKENLMNVIRDYNLTYGHIYEIEL